MSADTIALRVNGRAYSGWKSARITRGIETVAGSFELSVSDRWNGNETPWPIVEEDECIVTVNGVDLITGWVDSRTLDYDAKQHSLSVSGRDKAGELVDCSAVFKTWEYAQVALLSLAKKICAPFNIPVALDPSIKKLPAPYTKFTIDPGETAFGVLDRACQICGVLPVSDGQGGLLLTRAGTARADTQLIEGQNILHASAHYEATGRFGTYIVTAQKPGVDEDFGAGAASVKATSHDFEVVRTERILMIHQGEAMTLSLAKSRAQWEATIRKAKAVTFTVRVQGWTQASGVLWRPNELTRLTSPKIGVDGDLLITQVKMSLDASGGTLTELTLKPPDAFAPAPFIPKNASAPWVEVAHGVKAGGLGAK